MGYKWVTKNRGFAVNQALFEALLPNTFSKLPAKKTSGARHAFGSDSSGFFALNQQIAGGLSRAAGLGHVLGNGLLERRCLLVGRARHSNRVQSPRDTVGIDHMKRQVRLGGS